MATFFLAPYPTFGTAKNRRSEAFQKRSPYYWWWAYLKRNQDYLDCCANGGQGRLAHLYADFGDVRDKEFRLWWQEDRRGARLFGEQQLEVKFHEVESATNWHAEWTKDKVMVVAFPLAVGKRKLMGEIRKLLDKRHSGKQGRPALSKVESTAKYKLSRNYTTANLETALNVYDLWVLNNAKPKAEQIKQWEIGVELKLHKLAIKDAYSGLKQDRAVGRNLLGAMVKRYLTQAQKTIKSLEKGVFPVIK
ncbi:MAG: hypothetical protein ACK53K_05865 [Burkholderiales bacterium]